MKIIAVIPARYGSTRFPGKPLALIQHKPMIQWVYEGAKKSKLAQDIFVATDDERIFSTVQSFGGQVLMTSTDCPTGTDRIYQATQNMDFDIVINIQGDEPQITADYIDLLATSFIDHPSIDMATLAHPMSYDELQNVNAVKVITNINDEAIYFSRFSIPYSKINVSENDQMICQKHIGIYAYSKSFLEKFCQSPQSSLEKAESLEQLRALYLGAKIKVISVATPLQGVDTPEDLEKIKNLI